MRILSRLIKAIAAGSTLAGVGGLYHDGNITAPCDSPLYCHGQILQEIQLARPFADSKTFVDMPTKGTLEEIQVAFGQLEKPIRNGTQLIDFLSEYFAPSGAELIPLREANLITNATFLAEMNNSINQEFVEQIMSKWANLTRVFNESAVCAACQSSFIPIKRPFVIAGGRFREAYYWDSYWILHGLLRTGGNFTQISRNQIENFLDNVEQFGFVPNGARKYYLNRSQPPVLAQMVRIYLAFTGETAILDRGLPLLLREYDFFKRNRSVEVSIDNQTCLLNRYHVDNNQPRPESYREDWEQVNNKTFLASTGQLYLVPSLAQDQKALLYQNLASGAESGWDFSSRFLRNPQAAAEDTTFPLRSLNTLEMIPVELNSILYWNEIAIASFFDMTGDLDNAALWEAKAQYRSQAMHAVMWNEEYGTYFDYNITSGSQETFCARDADALPTETDSAPSNETQLVFNVAQLTPFLTGAALPRIKDDPKAVRRAFERVEQYLDTRAGGIAPTNFRTSQQWDQPNVWPPHMQMLMEALLKTPPSNGEDDPDWRWTQDLALRLGQRYLDSAYCTWRATGGESASSPKLSGLNGSTDLGGLMFEKYSDVSLNEAGGGGEYEVVVGFGWSNGVLIWVADTFRDRLKTPPCAGANFTLPVPGTGRSKVKRSAVMLDSWDAAWTSRWAGGKA